MKSIAARATLVALLAITGAGCGLSASPADGLQFHAPPDWRPSPGIMGFMQFWRSPANESEVLMLFKSPRPLRSRDIFANSAFHDTVKGATVEQRRIITICNNQPATYILARGTSSRGGADIVEMIGTNTGGSSYFAMYVRPVSALPNAAARAALREVCAKP